MWADMLTKPLQGKKFRLMRATLMNFPVDYKEQTNLNATCNMVNTVQYPLYHRGVFGND